MNNPPNENEPHRVFSDDEFNSVANILELEGAVTQSRLMELLGWPSSDPGGRVASLISQRRNRKVMKSLAPVDFEYDPALSLSTEPTADEVAFMRDVLDDETYGSTEALILLEPEKFSEPSDFDSKPALKNSKWDHESQPTTKTTRSDIISYDDVAEACDRIRRDVGTSAITVRGIRSALGDRGSMTTINAHIGTWREKARLIHDLVGTLDRDAADALSRAAQQAVASAVRREREERLREVTDLRREIADKEEEVAGLLEQMEQAQLEMDVAKANALENAKSAETMGKLLYSAEAAEADTRSECERLAAMVIEKETFAARLFDDVNHAGHRIEEERGLRQQAEQAATKFINDLHEATNREAHLSKLLETANEQLRMLESSKRLLDAANVRIEDLVARCSASDTRAFSLEDTLSGMEEQLRLSMAATSEATFRAAQSDTQAAVLAERAESASAALEKRTSEAVKARLQKAISEQEAAASSARADIASSQAHEATAAKLSAERRLIEVEAQLREARAEAAAERRSAAAISGGAADLNERLQKIENFLMNPRHG